MKQRSALLVAAGLVLALGLAAFGLATGMTGPSADAKPVRPDHRTPIVHTTTRTVAVHKKGDATGSASVVPATTASSAASTVSSGSSEDDSDDSYEHEHEAEDEAQDEDDDSGSGSDGDEAEFEGDDD